MQVWFAFTGADRPAAYVPVQVLSAAGTVAGALGLARLDRGGAPWIATGMGLNVVGRLLQVVLELTRLPLWLNVALALGFGFAMVVAIAWALGRPRTSRLQLAFALLALVHFLSMLWALSRLSAAFGLALGAAGFAMAAGFTHRGDGTR